MSKLADLIRRITRAGPAPMGFASSKRQSAASILLVAICSDHWQRTAAEAAGAGADLVLLTGRPGERELSDGVAAAGDTPCGVLLGEADGKQLDRLQEAGVDYVVLEPQAPASALQNEAVGQVLHLREELTDIQLRTLEALSIEALYLERDMSPLTIRSQIELRRVSGLSRKPLLVAIRPDALQEDLLALRDAGVLLVGIDMKERSAADGLRHLRQLIDGLPRRRRSRDDAEVRIPSMTGVAESEEDDDDE